jgi:hypothetical protein
MKSHPLGCALMGRPKPAAAKDRLRGGARVPGTRFEDVSTFAPHNFLKVILFQYTHGFNAWVWRAAPG